MHNQGNGMDKNEQRLKMIGASIKRKREKSG
jgi:hypothetical protein